MIRRGRIGVGTRRMMTLLVGVGLAGCLALDGPPAIGRRAPQLTVADFDGRRVSLADYMGSPVVVNLWATWCGPCRTEMPYLQSVYERYDEAGLEMVGISVDDESVLPRVGEFLEQVGVTYDQLYDPESISLDRFYALGLPATFILDSTGRFAYIRFGPIPGDPTFEETIRGLLASQE